MRYQKYLTEKPNDAIPGDLLVWFVTRTQFSHLTFYQPVASAEDAKMVLWALSMRDLFLEEALPGHYTIDMNAGGLMVWEDNGEGFDWFEWYSEDGDSIDDLMDAEQEEHS